MVTVWTVKTTGVVAFSVATKWRSVSLEIATALINGVKDYNQRTRQEQAAAERKFVEGRLALAASELRAAEERLESFLLTNRDIGSPEIVMQRDRFQRDVILRQQVYTSLTQSYEEARIREVRDTPVITMFESPWVPVKPESRGRLKGLALGTVLGGFVGALLAFMSDRTASRRKAGDVEGIRRYSERGEGRNAWATSAAQSAYATMIMDDRGCERGRATNLAWAERVRELVEHHRVNEVQGPWITV